MRDGKKCRSIVGLLFLTALFAACAATESEGVRWCIVSVIPLEDNRGGAIQMESSVGKTTLDVEIKLSGSVSKSDVDIYDRDGSSGTKWIEGSVDKTYRLRFTPGSTDYAVQLQEKGVFSWKDLWTKTYAWKKSISGDKGSWTMESKVGSSGTLEDTYWLDFGDGKAAGITLVGRLQDLE